MSCLLQTQREWNRLSAAEWKGEEMKSRNDREWENNRERIRRGLIQPVPSRDKSGSGSLRQNKCVTKTYWTRRKRLRNLRALFMKDTCKDAFPQGMFHNTACFVDRDKKLDCAWMPWCSRGLVRSRGGVWIAALLLSLTQPCTCLHKNSLRLAIRYCLDR